MLRWAFVFIVVFFAIGLVQAVPAPAPMSCEDLTKVSLASGRIDSAQTVAAGAFSPPDGGRGLAEAPYASLSAFCRVRLTLKPSTDSDIKVEIWLPATDWNGKYQAIGNGGFAGAIPYPNMALALSGGYATSGTDTGHVGHNADFVPGHPEKLVDFAYRAIHETAVKGKTIISARYGDAPTRSYFNGCSLGGKQALTSAQRYPDDFDGIVAGASAWDQMRMMGARLEFNLFAHRNADSWIPPSKYSMIHEAVLRFCDARDGLVDGVIEDPTQCNFDYASLTCKGPDGPSCLTPSQVESAKILIAPLKNPKTSAVLYEGHLMPGSELRWDVLAGKEPLPYTIMAFKNITFQNDPLWTPQKFNFATDIEFADKLDDGLLASRDFDLKPFFDRGGKLLMWHGWADPQVPPQNSTIYYSNVLKTVGKSAENSIALFMIPGVYHCNGGPGTDQWDKAAVLDDWVEHGVKPTRIIASHLTDGRVDKTRPLCPYGQVAKYKGSGDSNDAANFACVVQSGH
jgi:feruloyl esterase